MRFRGASYEEVPEKIRILFEKIRKTRRGIYIHGSVGIGKTYIAYALHKQFTRKFLSGGEEITEYSGVFVNASELFADMKRDFDRPFTEKKEPMARLLESRKLLFIDDIGAEKLSEWVAAEFYLLLNHRYNEMLPTIFTSNLTLTELAERLGDRTVSRIAGMCDVVKLDGDDRRLTEEVREIAPLEDEVQKPKYQDVLSRRTNQLKSLKDLLPPPNKRR